MLLRVSVLFYKINGKKRHAATVGDINCLSFNANKIITTGGGGMIIFKDKKDYQRAAYLSSQAKDDSTFFIHNEVDIIFVFQDYILQSV